MGQIFKIYLSSDSGNVYACSACFTHLANDCKILSKAFQGQYGRAILFDQVVNVLEGKLETRTMTTGMHAVRDIYCVECKRVMGWKYEKAYEESQRYKEGKYILEVARTVLDD